MKGITMCADCAYYNIKTHKCTLGCTGEPGIENGDDVRFFTDCPLPNVVEVRHGRWIRRETVLDVECKCSVCGYKDFVPKHDNYWFRRKFCPNCGAKMREGGAENA